MAHIDIRKVRELVLSNVQSYYNSTVYKTLEKKYLKMKEVFYLRHDIGDFDVKIILPILRPIALMDMAIISNNFNINPMFSAYPVGGTLKDQSDLLSDLYNYNLTRIDYRRRVFNKAVFDLALYGCSVTTSAWASYANVVPKTVSIGGVVQRQMIEEAGQRIEKARKNPLDYFQNPDISDPEMSDYQGIVDRLPAYQFVANIKRSPELYDLEAVTKVMKLLKQGSVLSEYHHYKQTQESKYQENQEQNGFIDIIKMYFRMSGAGLDSTDYYCEMVGDEIIRFHENPHDYYHRPIHIITTYPREDSWYGDAKCAPVLTHQQFSDILNSLKARNAIQNLNNYIVYDKNRIGRDQLNERYLGVDVKPNEELDKLIYQIQPRDTMTASTESIENRILENLQRHDPRPDLNRTPSKGGLINTSATGVNAILESRDFITKKYLDDIAMDLCAMAVKDSRMIQQFTPYAFLFKPQRAMNEIEVLKEMILGDITFEMRSSLDSNKMLNLQNGRDLITTLLNWQGTGHPVFQSINMESIIKDFLRNSDVDIDKVYQQAQQMIQQQPGMAQQQPQMQGAQNAA